MGPTTWHASKTARQHRGSSELRAKRFMSNTDGSAVSRIRCCCEWSVNCISYTWWWWVDIHEYSHGGCQRRIEKSLFECNEQEQVWQRRLTGHQSGIIPMYPVCTSHWMPNNTISWNILLHHSATCWSKKRWSTMSRWCTQKRNRKVALKSDPYC